VTYWTPSDRPERRSSLRTRLISFAALCGAVSAIGYVASTVYHVATDGFVAPIALSPDSDLVIQSKLSMSQLLAERMRITAKREATAAELEGASEALEELKALHASSAKALEWTSTLTTNEALAGAEDQRVLVQQRAALARMIADEESLLDRMKKDLDAGLISKVEYARQAHALDQLRVASLENERARITRNVQMNQLRLTQQALRGSRDRSQVSTPEMLAQQDQMVRVKCEMIRLQAEQRSKTAEQRTLDEELTKLDELLAQLKARPIFRAIEADTNVAFVPYTQIAGVGPGAEIYDCVWGVFACKSVGRIAELLPGEALVQDPWGSPARGQYAIMRLDDAEAAQSKTLRVRPSSRPLSPAPPAPSPVASRLIE